MGMFVALIAGALTAAGMIAIDAPATVREVTQVAEIAQAATTMNTDGAWLFGTGVASGLLRWRFVSSLVVSSICPLLFLASCRVCGRSGLEKLLADEKTDALAVAWGWMISLFLIGGCVICFHSDWLHILIAREHYLAAYVAGGCK
jgi:hypothetical protein